MLRFLLRLVHLLVLTIRVAPMLLLALLSFSRALPATRKITGSLLLLFRIAQVEMEALVD